MNASQVADRLENYSARLRNGSLYRARALWTVWRSFNDPVNPLRASDIRRHLGASTINLLASAALHETIMIVVRSLDSPGRGALVGSNRVSFPVLAALLDVDGVQDELIGRARHWFTDDYKADENQVSVRKAIAAFRRDTEILKDSDGARKLRDFRDEFLAHNLEFEEERNRPIINDVTDLLEKLTTLANKGSLAFEGSSTAWDLGEEQYRISATDLWQLIERGARAN